MNARSRPMKRQMLIEHERVTGSDVIAKFDH